MSDKETRFVNFLDSKVADNTYQGYTIIFYSDDSNRAVFKALLPDNTKVFYYLDEIYDSSYSYNISDVPNVGSYPSMEQRFIAYVNSKITDNTFDVASISQIWEEIGKCQIRAAINGTVKFYYITEIHADTYYSDLGGITSTFSYTYIELTNVSDNNVVALNDTRIDKILMNAAQDLPKSTSCSADSDNSCTNIRTENQLALWKECIKNDLFPVDADIKSGIDLVEIDDKDLTSEELTKKYVVLNWIYKLNARFKIEAEVGDVYDLIADASKRIALVERLVMRCFGQVFNVYPWDNDTQTRYQDYIAWYLNLIDTGEYVDRADLENEQELINTLLTRSGTISKIVKTEYFDNKK